MYEPSDPIRRQQSQLNRLQPRPEKLSINTPLERLRSNDQVSLIQFLDDWLADVRSAMAAHVEEKKMMPLTFTPSPLVYSATQWFTQEGNIATFGREPYCMALCNAALRGYGFRVLGLPGFSRIDLRACAGQFEYSLTDCIVDGHPVSSVVAISPLKLHQHSGQPCRSRPMPFRGFDGRLPLFRGDITAEQEAASFPYVSFFFIFLPNFDEIPLCD